MWVCLCRAVNSGTINALIEAGATSVRELSEATGVATDCTKCTRTIHMLLEQQKVADPADRPGGPS